MIRNFIPLCLIRLLYKDAAQLTDRKAAAEKHQQRTVGREAAHRGHAAAQAAERLLRPLRKEKIEYQQRKRQMEQPGAVERAEGHLGRADGPHLHQNRKPLHAQRRAAQHTGEPAAFCSQVTAGADLQKHRAENACTGGQHFPRSCGQHPENRTKPQSLR